MRRVVTRITILPDGKGYQVDYKPLYQWCYVGKFKTMLEAQNCIKVIK